MDHVTIPITKIAAIWLALVAAAALALALAPSARADEPEKYDLWVGGVQVTSDNAADVLGDGTVAYDPVKRVLTLEDATISAAIDPNETRLAQAYGINELINEPMTIELKGDNKITCDIESLEPPAAVEQSFLQVDGIYSYYTKSSDSADPYGLRVVGDGSLMFDFAMTDPKVPEVMGKRPHVEFMGIVGAQAVNIQADISYVSGSPDVMFDESSGVAFAGFGYVIDGDAYIDISFGRHAERHNMRSAQYMNAAWSTLGGNAVVNVDFADGSDYVCGGGGGHNLIKDNAVLNVHAGKAITASYGYSCGDFDVQGNATVTLVSDGIVDGSDSTHTVALACGQCEISDNATVTLVGRAAYSAPEPNLNGHKVGGAVVSQTQSILPADAVVWDGQVPFNQMDSETGEGYYKFIRVPGTADAAADIAAAGAVLDMIDALPEPKDATEDDKAAVEKAWEAFENLTDEQELLLPEEAVEKLAALYDELRDPEVERIAGDYANETAAAIALAAFPEGCDGVVIARDDDFADALGASGLAGTLQCPIVLTGREELAEAAADAIAELGADKAYIVGGTGAITTQVDDDLKALGVEVEPRIWGENSYDTSLACAQKIVELGGDADRAVIAMSTNFQDALSFSPVAYELKLPVVLQTWGDTSAERGFTDEAHEWLSGKELTIAGGPGAISEESLSGLEVADRVYGETGYDTSNEIASWGLEKGYFTERAAVFACGAQAPKGVDALAGAALAGRLGAPILLVNGNEEMEAVDTTTVDGYFAEHAKSCKDVYILGGEYVMPPSLVEKIEALLG